MTPFESLWIFSEYEIYSYYCSLKWTEILKMERKKTQMPCEWSGVKRRSNSSIQPQLPRITLSCLFPESMDIDLKNVHFLIIDKLGLNLLKVIFWNLVFPKRWKSQNGPKALKLASSGLGWNICIHAPNSYLTWGGFPSLILTPWILQVIFWGSQFFDDFSAWIDIFSQTKFSKHQLHRKEKNTWNYKVFDHPK